jgi:hypothetical protein
LTNASKKQLQIHQAVACDAAQKPDYCPVQECCGSGFGDPASSKPVHAEIEGRRSGAASGQNSERVGDEVYVCSVSQPPRRLLVFIGSSQRFIFLSSIRLITAQLIQAETATFIKQAETDYLIVVNLSSLSSRN